MTPAGSVVASASPSHGQWRLLAPAIVCWAAAAVVVHIPGAAIWFEVVLGIGGVGIAAILAARRRARGATGQSKWGWTGGAGLLCVAALLAVIGRVAVVEHGRDSVSEALSRFGGGARVAATVVVGGYPAPAASARGDDAERSWVRGRLVRLVPAPGSGSHDVDLESGCGGGVHAPLPAAVPPSVSVPVPVPVPASASAILWLDGAPPAGWYPGATVCAAGTLTRGPPESLAAFELSVSSTVGPHAAGNVPATLGEAAAALRLGLRAAAAGVRGAELVPGLAVGDTSLVSDSLDRLMLESNLTHLTAVSGSNCALVIAAAVAAARAMGLGRRGRVLIAGGALIAFVVIVGPDASVQRAAIMAGVLLAGNFGGKQGRSLPALGLAILVLLLADPWQAIQPGFALSVVATAGILLAATPVNAWLRRRARMPQVLALPLAVAVVAQVSCAPLLLLLQPGFSLGGVLANLLAAPAAPAGTAAGLAALILLALPGGSGVLALWGATWPARWIEAAGEVGAALPGGRLFWPEGWGGAATLTAVYCLAWLARIFVRRSQRGLAAPGSVAAVHYRQPWPSSRTRAVRHRRGWIGPVRTALVPALAAWITAGAAVGIAGGVTVVVPLVLRLGVPADWAIVACDVGQGDAVLLRDPGVKSEVMLVDTGDDPDALEACLDVFGVERISLLVLTHDHWDHVGALDAVSGRVDSALLPPDSGDDLGRSRIGDRIVEAGIPAVEATAGMAGAGVRADTGISRSETAGMRWEVLAPPVRASYRDVNATSLVLRVDVGALTVLMLGDTGANEQEPLLRSHPGLTADVVKVAHHGSRDQAPGMYDLLGARAALISVGSGNRYGHPNSELVDTLAATGAEVLRTDEHGSLAIVDRRGEMTYWAAGGAARPGRSRDRAWRPQPPERPGPVNPLTWPGRAPGTRAALRAWRKTR
ncbi:ComEC/Rec2 family competence protein [Leucobacter aridicollis]|uniref:ComEC/Rec2 family competence protein n=1 Tax=Leucobacter aridicollis TaxID=283878 RepID=UPI00210703DC|nr:ComEC/Rec2 family competence protein [Leucobacter aridicollis]UTX51864.1 ComEC/Rec2 family competence protein [Leucobacter aridicollis]